MAFFSFSITNQWKLEVAIAFRQEPNVRILQNNVTLESERYTAEFLNIECLNIA